MGKYALEDIFELIEKEGDGVDLDMEIDEIDKIVSYIEEMEGGK